MATDDRDETGDESRDRAHPDTHPPHELGPTVGVAVGWFDDAEREAKHKQDDALTLNPASVIARRPMRDSGHHRIPRRVRDGVVIL